MLAIDRCDRCHAQAYVRVRLNAGTLDFCSHHFQQNQDALADAILLHDDRPKLAVG